jgi:COP9 signalosome complex subunit 1
MITVDMATIKQTHPTWDLDQYYLNYSGHGQIQRLKFVASKSPPLQVDALIHAVQLIKENTLNVSLYQEAVEQLRLANPSLPESTVDRAWVDHALRTSKLTSERLETELKAYKTNLIKESIRVRPVNHLQS